MNTKVLFAEHVTQSNSKTLDMVDRVIITIVATMLLAAMMTPLWVFLYKWGQLPV